MPGTRVSDISGKADTVVVAARHDPQDGNLVLAQAYERRGAVWGDVVLLDREALLARLRSRRRVYSGAVGRDIPGDFVGCARVELASGAHGVMRLARGASSADHDDLGVPAF